MEPVAPKRSRRNRWRRCSADSWDLRIRLWYEDDRGATVVEYSLLAALIAAVIVGLVATIGTDVSSALQGFVSAF